MVTPINRYAWKSSSVNAVGLMPVHHVSDAFGVVGAGPSY
jgi:hypothetical protein